MIKPSEPAASWSLKPFPSVGIAERTPLAPTTTLGRAATNTVVLAESSFPGVSAHHARISIGADGAPAVEDLGSRNGTFVNDERVERAVLRDGDVLRLGVGGPSYVVEQTGDPATRQISPSALARSRHPDLTQSGLVRIKRALGVPESADVGQLVASSARQSRRWTWIATGAIAVLAAGTTIAVRAMGRDDMQRLAADLQTRLASTSSAFEEQRIAWEQQKVRLERDRATLQQRIQDLAAHEQTAAGEVTGLRQSLAETITRLASYDPINVERTRLQDVGRVQSAVVFVETKMRLRSTKTQLLLRMRRDLDPNTGTAMTFDESDEPFERASSGSGFCIADDGSIVTNAHVVLPPGCDQVIEIDSGENLKPELVYEVAFSGSVDRHAATVVRALDTGDADLALLKIAPFAAMPHLAGFHTDMATPAAGTEVYLHGFPLGKMAMQDGDRVIASSFRGILSRTVSNWIQVDAAVHPGNSGGPLTDSAGNVIGVVCRVQRLSDETIAPDMGYAIPVQMVARLLESEAGK